jgi:hypothetical protein
MSLKTIALATALTTISSIAFAQAPIGSSADFGNGALINRGPVPSVGQDMDYRANRSSWGPLYAPRHRHFTARRHRHVAERAR